MRVRADRRIAFCILLILGITSPLLAMNLPRGTLWRVEETCILNERTTGSPFPCLVVDLDKGYALLRAPFRQTHIVAMPTIRVSGIEDPRLREDGPSYFEAAWNARSFLQEDLKRKLAWGDVGLAVNSRLTRSQDQMHIHIDCVREGVRQELAGRLAGIPADRWQPETYRFEGQVYWGRRIEQATLAGVHVARLVDEIPPLRDHPARAIVAVLGTVDPARGNGFLLLAGESDPARFDHQSTSEDLLDHQCRRAS